MGILTIAHNNRTGAYKNLGEHWWLEVQEHNQPALV
jgi:hypothetical protein